MLEATTYTGTCGQQQLGKCLCVSKESTNAEKVSLQNYISVKYFRMFSLYENFFTMKIKRITVTVLM